MQLGNPKAGIGEYRDSGLVRRRQTGGSGGLITVIQDSLSNCSKLAQRLTVALRGQRYGGEGR